MNQVLYEFFVLPSRSNPDSPRQLQSIGAAEQRMHCGNSPEIYDAAAVDTGKLGGIEPAFQTGHGFTKQVSLCSTVQLHVIIRRLDPVNTVDRHEFVTI